MKKVLRTKDKLLMVGALFGDIVLEAYIHGMMNKPKGFLDSVVNPKKHSLRAALSRSLITGDMSKEVDAKGKVFYKLSQQGKTKFVHYYPLSRLRDSGWDNKWRFVVFDIPEEKRGNRDQLRRDLISLGFGKLQESIYVTPLDILVDLKEVLKSKGYGQWVMVFEAEQKLTDQAYRMASIVWPLEQLNKEYMGILDEISWQKKNPPTEKENKELKERYYELLARDPFLPKELLPDDWKGDLVQKLMLQSL